MQTLHQDIIGPENLFDSPNLQWQLHGIIEEEPKPLVSREITVLTQKCFVGLAVVKLDVRYMPLVQMHFKAALL